MEPIRPTILHFHVTTRCPFSCRHCSAEAGVAGGGPETGLGEIHRILDRAAQFGMDELDLSGGEPLARGKDFILEILRHATTLGLVTTLNTNTWFLDTRLAATLVEVGLDRLKTSLYGATAATHDAFTGRAGSFDRLLAALRLLGESGIETWVNFVVMPANLEEAARLPELLDPYGPEVLQVSSIIPSGRGERADRDLFEPGSLGAVIERLTSELVFPGRTTVAFTTSLYPDPRGYPFGDRFCDYLKERLVVDPSGHVIPCCLLPGRLRHRAGNLLEAVPAEVLHPRRLASDPVFHWLAEGHRAMREALGGGSQSHNLCTACIEMLGTLADRA